MKNRLTNQAAPIEAPQKSNMTNRKEINRTIQWVMKITPQMEKLAIKTRRTH
jgi:hypothetical protein